MSTLIMYYTLAGSSARVANDLKNTEDKAKVVEIKEVKKRGIIRAFIPGCPNAMKRIASKIQPMNEKLEQYDKIILVAPIWAGHPAPAFNAMMNLVPKGKDVELYLCSGGGDSSKSKQGTIDLFESKGCHVLGYHDVATAAKK